MIQIDCPKLVKSSIILSIFFLVLFPSAALALSSNTINFQGKIVRNDTGFEGLNVTAGSPACVVAGNSNDTCDFEVKYYSASSGGTLLLTEHYLNAEIGQFNGAFTLSLGSDGSPTAGSYATFDAMIKGVTDLYVQLGFSPAGNATYSETFSRMPIQASAYALKAKYASGANTAFQFDSAANSSGYTAPVAGMVYYDTTDNALKVYNGSAWGGLGSGTGSLFTDGGIFTYLTSLTDHFVLGSSSYTAIGADSYTTYLSGLSTRPSLSFDMTAERLTISGSQAQSGLTVYSNYASTGGWPVATFKAEDSGFDNVVMQITQDGTGNILSLQKGSTDAFVFENPLTFYIHPRLDAPTVTADRLYNVNGTLYWNGSAVGGGSSSLWTDAGTFTYLTSTTDDVVIGGDTLGTAAFFFDVSTGNFGIGTSTPGAKLDIAGSNSTISNTTGDITISPDDALVIKANDTQADVMTKWESSTGTVLSLINQNGYASFGTNTNNAGAMLTLGASTGTVAQINLAAGSDVALPNSGDMWWNGTSLYFFDGSTSVDLLTAGGGGSNVLANYGAVSNGAYLSVEHDTNSYDVVASGWICVNGSSDASCTGGNWKNVQETDFTITHSLSNQWSDANVNGIIRSVIKTTSVELAPTVNIGSGADGDITIGTVSKDINATNIATGRACTDGGDAVNYNVVSFNALGTEATLSSSPSVGCLNPNDEILIINLRGTGTSTNNVGNYETLKVQSVTGTTVVFRTAKTKYYGDGLTNDSNIGVSSSSQIVMLQRVPNYGNVTVNNGYSLYPTTWTTSGTKGGVLFFRATGSVVVNGTISANGFAGGSVTGSYTAGYTGQSLTSSVSTASCNANGSGGGGGGAGINGTVSGGGGGGGGYVTAGGNGTRENGNTCLGIGGSSLTLNTASLDKLIMGGAGGSGGIHSPSTIYGGAGGGIILLGANYISVSGTISANGGNGTTPGGTYSGGGGGGAGGSIRLEVVNSDLGSSKVVANGGAGASGTNAGGTGGSGGTGRVAIYHSSTISGTSSPSYSDTTVGRYGYGVYTSSVITTPNAQSYDNLRWDASLNTYGKVSVQTRSGATSDPTDGTWEGWKPYTSGTNYTILQSADTHTDWTGTNATVAEGDITRGSIYGFEDEMEPLGTNITKVTSNTNGGYMESTITAADLSNYDYVTLWVRASQVGNVLRIGMGEAAGTEQYEDITIDVANTWQKVYWDISDIAVGSRDAITKLRLTNFSASSNVIYLDNIKAEKLLSVSTGSVVASTPNQYFQYRVIFTTTNLSYQPQLESISLAYNSGYRIVMYDANNVRLYNYSGGNQYMRLEVVASTGSGGSGGAGFINGLAVSHVANGADAIAFQFNTSVAFTDPSSKLLSVMNNSVEKMYLDANGNLYVAGTVISGKGLGAALVNHSGGIVAEKSLVTVDSTTNGAFTTTTVPGLQGALGVVQGVEVNGDVDSDGVCDNGDTCLVAFEGVVDVKLDNAASSSKGDYVYSSTVAGQGHSASGTTQTNGMLGVVTSTATSGSGYVKMVFDAQNKVTADMYLNVSYDENVYRDIYNQLANDYTAMSDAERRGYLESNQSQTVMFDNFVDSLKIDSANSTIGVDADARKAGLWGGLTLDGTTLDIAGNRYLGSSTATLLFSKYYDRTQSGLQDQDSTPTTLVATGVDPNWYNGVSLQTATNLSTTYNGGLISVSGVYGTGSEHGYIDLTITSTTTTGITANIVSSDGNCTATGASLSFGSAYAFASGSCSGSSITINPVRSAYNSGDRFRIASWFVEPTTADDRGSSRQFPQRSIILGSGTASYMYVTIVDADTQRVWMKFAANGAAYSSANMLMNNTGSAIDSIFMLNGQLYVVGDGVSTQAGDTRINFNTDSSTSIYSSGYYKFSGTIGSRNTAGVYGLVNNSVVMVENEINDVHAAVVNNILYSAYATEEGITIVDEKNLAVEHLDYTTGVDDNYNQVFIDASRGAIWYTMQLNGVTTLRLSAKLLSELTFDGSTLATGNTRSWLVITTSSPRFLASANNIFTELYVNQASGDIYASNADGVYRISGTFSAATPTVNNAYIQRYSWGLITEKLYGDTRGYWPLNFDTTTADNEDHSGYGNTLSVNGVDATNSVSGVRRTAVALNGTDEYLYRASDADFDVSTQFTMSAWIKTSTSGTTIISRYGLSTSGSVNSNSMYNLTINSNAIRIQARDDTDTTAQTLQGTIVVTDNAWHQVVGIVDKTNTLLSIYVDGQLDTSATLTETGAYTFDDSLFIGVGLGSTGVYSGYFNGSIDELTIAQTAYPSPIIKSMYEDGFRALKGSHSIDDSYNGLIGTNDIRSLLITPDSKYMYVGTEGGGISKIDLTSSTRLNAYTTATDPSTSTNNIETLSGRYYPVFSGDIGSSGKLMGIDSNGNNSTGTYYSEVTTFAESTNRAFLWMTASIDATDPSSSIVVSASNDNGSNYVTGTLIQTNTSGSLPEYEYSFVFPTSSNNYKVRFVINRGSSNKATTYVTKWGLSQMKMDNATVNGLFTNSNDIIANGSYLEVVHGQNTYDLVANGWVFDTTLNKWVEISNTDNGITQNLSNQWQDANVNGIIRSIVKLTDVELAPGVNVGTGADGAITVSSNTNINRTSLITGRTCADGGDAVNYNITAFNAGGTNATLNRAPSTGCLNPGDEVLIINLQGANSYFGNVGNYETLRVANVNATTVTFTTAKSKYYGNNLGDDTNIGTTTGTQRVMLQRVPNYNDVTVNTGVNFYPDAWSTEAAENATYRVSKGGVMFFRSNGTVSVVGNIHANGLGFLGATTRGAYGGGDNAGRSGAAGGEAYCGPGGLGAAYQVSGGAGAAGGGSGSVAGTGGTGYCGGGGGGVVAGVGSVTAGGAGGGAEGYDGAGGGAGYGSAGAGGAGEGTAAASGGTNSSGNGGAATQNAGGGGGGTYGVADLTKLLFGSGGGKGTDYEVAGDYLGDGGNGGGIIGVYASTLTVTGTLKSAGGDGEANTGGSYGGGGGGGAGGSLLISGKTITLGTGLTGVSGGAGGAGQRKTGGAGGNGRIAIYNTSTYSGTTINAAQTNAYTIGYYSYGVYTSSVIATPNAQSYDNLKWNAALNTYGKISVQTRSGATNDPTDGTWEAWSPYTSGTNYTTLQSMDTHTDWTGTNATVAEGDITRPAAYGFEDDTEPLGTNITKVTSSTNGGYMESTITPTDLTNYDYVTLWVRAGQAGNTLRIGMGEAAGTEQYEDITIDTANVWQKVYWDLSDIAVGSRDAITKLRLTNYSTSSNVIYLDNIKGEELLSTGSSSVISSTPNTYFQYRAIFTTTNLSYQPQLENMTFTYSSGFKIQMTDANTVRLYNNSGKAQKLKLDIILGSAAIDLRSSEYSLNIAPSSAQIDGGTNTNSIWVNKLGTGGNLLKLQTNSNDMLVVDSTGNMTLAGVVSVTGGSLTLGVTGDQGTIRYNATSNRIEFSNDGINWLALGDSTRKFVLSAEYPGAVLSGDGTNNTGTMTSDNTGASSNSMNYYNWTSSAVSLNDYDVRVRFTLPSDFSGWGTTGGVTLNYVTQSTSATNNAVDMYIYKDSSSTIDGTSTGNVSTVAGTWQTVNVSATNFQYCKTAGDTCVVILRMSSMNSNYVRVGDIAVTYNRSL